MNKQEINKRIAELLLKQRTPSTCESDDYLEFIVKPSYDKDYCNDWADLMPLVDFNYEIMKTESGLFHCSVLPDWYLGDVKIGTRMAVRTKQTALAECLLKILENKK